MKPSWKILKCLRIWSNLNRVFKSDIEIIKAKVSKFINSQYLGEMSTYKTLLNTKTKQYEDLRRDLDSKCAENLTLKMRTQARVSPYLIFEKKLHWVQNNVFSKIPNHECMCKYWCRTISTDSSYESTMDMTDPSVDGTSSNDEMPKIMDEPWKTISEFQSDLKNVDIENKSLHKYLTTLKIEEKFQEETIMSSEIVQKLLKQGLALVKHTENLRKTAEEAKSEVVTLREKHLEDINELEEQNKETQLMFKNKMNELTDNYLNIVSEKENMEQLYIESKSAETQLTEVLDNIKEYQKVTEENRKEKEILKKQYLDMKSQFEALLEKRSKQGIENCEFNVIADTKPELQVGLWMTEIERLETCVDEQKARVETLESELEELTNVNNSLSTQKIKILQKLDLYAHNQSKFIKASTKSSKLHRITQLEKENYLKWAQDKDDQILTLTNELNQCLMKTAKFEGQVNQLESSSKAKDEIISTLKDENSTIIIKNDEVKSKLDLQKGTVATLEAKVVKLHSKISKKRIREDIFVNMKEIYDEESTEKTEKYEKQLHELNYYKKKILCELCMNNEKNVILTPWRHVFCSDCVYGHSKGIKRRNHKIFKNCPKCDTQYDGFQLLWI